MASTKEQQQCSSQYYYVGATIDNRYRLTDFIGVGGMACVYRAREMGAPHEFALKFLKSEYHNMDYLVEYFQDEANSMQNLAHPNIVRFYRFVNRDDYSYIVMDYVDGFALSQVLKLARNKQTAMPLDEVVRVMVQIARALDAIHRDNFVHRDIKPSNVLIDRKTGKAYLTDLGITSTTGAKIEGAGTIAYMSPEQAETWTADLRSDVYAYGILVYEMLTGKRPFNVEPGLRGSEAEADLLRKHKEMPIPHVTKLRSDLPSELNDVLVKAMAKHPDDRYQSVIAFAQDVHTLLKGKLSADMQSFESLQHRQIAAPTPAPAESQNVTRLVGVIGIAAFILALLLIFGLVANGSLDVPFINTATPTSTATPLPTRTPTPTLTPTENPVEGERFRFPFLNGSDALSEPDDPESLIIVPTEGEVFNYLRINQVGGFRIVMDIMSLDSVTRYGVAFRMQDTSNYYLFVVDALSLEWQLQTVVDGVASESQTGTFQTAPRQLTVAGVGNFFEIRSGSEVITLQSDTYMTGSAAIYLESGILELEDLQISILGEAARDAVVMTPTPSLGLANPVRFILADVTAMIETNNPLDTAIDCPTYISIYDSLDRHLESNNADVVSAARQAINAGAVVYQRCLIESPDDELDFTEFIQDYSDWELSLLSLEEQLMQ